MRKKLECLLVTLLMAIVNIVAQERVSVNNIELAVGTDTTFDILYNVDESNTYVGFMFFVELPQGLSLVGEDDRPGYPWYDPEVSAIKKMTITTTTSNGFAATPRTLSSTIKGNEGVLMRLQIKADSNIELGTYTAKLTDVSFNLRDENYSVTKIVLDDVPFDIVVTTQSQLLPKGDVNKDGAVDIADVVAVYNIMAGTNPNGLNGDVNKDGAVDIADVVAVYNIMAGGHVVNAVRSGLRPGGASRRSKQTVPKK